MSHLNDETIIQHVLAVHQSFNSESNAVLETVIEAPDALHVAERLLAASREPAVLFFALTIVEVCARRRWWHHSRIDRVRLRDGIAAYAVASNDVDDVVTRKAVQVHVAIGKAEW
jgi:hypothetical protein